MQSFVKKVGVLLQYSFQILPQTFYSDNLDLACMGSGKCSNLEKWSGGSQGGWLTGGTSKISTLSISKK